MSVKLKLQPFSAIASQTKSISFVLSSFDASKKYRISFENATLNKDAKIISCKTGTNSGNKLFISNTEEVSGTIDLSLLETDVVSVVSIYANVEEYTESEKWRLSDIAAFSFQIENSSKKTTGDKISIYPPFVGLEQKATIKVNTEPNSNLHVIVNSKKFIIKSNFSGEGSFSFRAIDVLGGSSSSSNVVQKFQVTYSKPNDGYKEIYDSGSFIHFVPESMKALQATNDPEVPECAILDATPGQGLTIQKLDDFCIDGPVVGPYSIFDSSATDSTFYNSKVGFCTNPKQVYPTASNDAVCRIFNSTSSSTLNNGSGLVVFSSQETFASDPYVFPTLSSRVFVAHVPSSLKYKGNPVRNGSVIKPPKFYHTITPDNISANEKYSITFRVDDGTVFEIQFTTIQGGISELIAAFTSLINANLNTRYYSIKAIDQSLYIEIESETRFTIRTDVISGNGTLETELKSNRTLDVLTDEKGIADTGNTLIFLTPKVGYQSHSIVSRDTVNKIIRIDVPSGFNNDVGPNIYDNIYCQKFVVVDSETEQPTTDLIEVNPLPYVYDIFNREVSCVYPVIATRKIQSTGEDIAYVVCQAPVDGVYQLFFYSFRVGSLVENGQWKQLTQTGENKNAKIVCDNAGNLHIIWESDRMGSTQVYYSVLGSSSRSIVNSSIMSVLDKNVSQGNTVDLVSISAPPYYIQDNWTRIIQGKGKVSVNDSKYVAIEGDPSSDAAMAFFSLKKDEFDNEIPWNLSQLSYHLSFQLLMPLLPTGVLETSDIQDKFAEWKSEFTPVGNYKYEKDNNIYTIDSYNQYCENIIPICGAYKLKPDDLRVISGGETVSDVVHRKSMTYVDFNDSAKLSQPSNIRHFMLAMMPEKIKFRAKNTESYVQYCERLGSGFSDCSGFNNEIEYVLPTGKYKLALLISTSENEGPISSSNKNYKIASFLSGYIDFRSLKTIDIIVHYSKMSSDYLEDVVAREREPFVNEYRFSGDIVVSVDSRAVFAKSFLADFSDQYRQFEIGLGFPPGQGFVIDDSIPYKGNAYEPGTMKQIFQQTTIGVPNIEFNAKYFDFSSFDRDTSQIVITEKVKNIISNGGFEETVLPYSDETILLDGYQGVENWTVRYGSIYRRKIDSDITKPKSWIELTGISVEYSILKGSIFSSIDTVVGKNYYVLFDSSNSVDVYKQGNSVNKVVKVTAGLSSALFDIYSTETSSTKLKWKTRSFKFVATSTNTIINIENYSSQFGDIRDIQFGPQIDNVIVIAEEDLNDELASFTTAENLMIDQAEFDLNYSLNSTDNFSQFPITVSFDYQNKNPDIFIDKSDKAHVVWQSNRNNYWDIYYSGFRNREIPFMHDIRITEAESNSVNPSIAVDGKGRRLITWQDNRNGKNQIYAALSKSIDNSIADQCKQDEVDEFIYQWNNSIDPYYDPYSLPISQLNSAIEFTFTAPSNSPFHFNLLFYEDKNYIIPYKVITSRNNISGWKVDNNQFEYGGLDAVEEQVYNISYLPSYEDSLSGRVLYVVVQFELNSMPIDFRNSTNLKILQPYNGLDLFTSKNEDNNFRAILEFDDLAPIGVGPQTKESLATNLFTGITFDSPLSELPGFEIGDRVKSVLLHFDPIGISGRITSVIRFTSPIVSIFVSSNNVINTNAYFGYTGIKYPTLSVIGLESFDKVNISADRKTITVTSFVNPSLDQVRVILADDSSVIGQNEFVYYCPEKQMARCEVKCQFINNFLVDKYVHFRVTFYANPEKTDVIASSFTKTDTLNWLYGKQSFPTNGLLVKSNQIINVVYMPEILPFDLYESQSSSNFSSSVIRQPLLCGATYQVVVETYRDGVFYVESESEFICPCAKTDSFAWDKEEDSINWICSGQGFDDFRISITDNECLNPKVLVNDLDFFYITWSDFRYSGLLENQTKLSPDYFMAMYDASDDRFICSGQGGYDRRLTNFGTNGLVLYNFSTFIDPFQNINMVMHNGEKVYWNSCSIGCKLTSINKDLILPCMFTDETDPSFFVVGGSPERNIQQYQKIRIAKKYVSYSTYVDLNKPITVVNDCFIEFDIIGVPGTYAYRLRNENDEEWSEWLPIGPDLPTQSQKDKSSTKSERDFFRAYFIERDVFVAPWVISQGNGLKRVCCEILTFFGKTETFCIDFMAMYDNLEYKVDLFFDSEFNNPVPKYKNYMVVSEYETETAINDTDLTSIKEEATKISTIYARIEFKDKQKLKSLEKLQTLSKFSYSTQLTMSVYQQGISDQLELPLTKISEGIYGGSFSIDSDDGVVNVDGLAIITIDVPGQCKQIDYSEFAQRAEKIENNRTLDQSVSVFDDFTVFQDKYNGDDVKGSFGNPNYYKIRKFGLNNDYNK